jgi:phosphoglycolate phosphatase
MLKYIVFDFDGTLVNSKDVFITAFNQLAEKHRFEKIQHEKIDHLRTLSIPARCKQLRVPLYKIPLLTGEFLSLYKKCAHEIQLADGMKAVLDELVKVGYKIAVISSNSENIIKLVLDKNGISHVTDVYCYNKLFGKDKIIGKFLRKKKLTSDEIIYVGDEHRDVIACKKNNVKIIWVSWVLIY